MSTQSEAVLEEQLINSLISDGYERIELRNEESLNSNFKKQLEKFNNCTLTDSEFSQLLRFLNEGTIFDKAKKLRDRYYVEREKDSFYIKFLNEKDWCKNIFQVSNQITVNGKYKNRYDVSILINGLPLVQIELKRRGMPIKEAFNQIQRYRRHSYKGLFNYIQIFVISNGVNTKYYANSIQEPSFEFTFFWKDKENNNINSLEEFSKTFLEKCNIAKMISRYVVLNESSKTLMVLRAYQKYAVEAVLNQALEYKQNGYIWHTTGSGKTLTSFKTSQLLSEEESIDKVIFVVDRRDLDIQTNKEFNSFCKGCVDYSKHTGILVRNLLNEKTSIINTTIQKLSKAISTTHDKKKLEKIKNKRIIFIYDECHRSQFGKMHKDIEEFFENSLSFGFTGTPIFAKNAGGGRTTKDVFKKRLHSYVIKDAIADQNVLGFSVEYWGGAKLKSNREDEEVASIDTDEYYNNDKRVGQIVDNIIENYDKKTKNREFNAMLTVSRSKNNVKPIQKYYEMFKKKNHDLKVAAIFTYAANEDLEDKEIHSQDFINECMSDYNKMFGTNFSTEDFKGYHADVSKRMKNRDIDLLIVVDMFLTGFDSKLLNTLYVDKNLQYHSLLQAFSRTNRIYNKRKSQGNIVCYRFIKDQTDEAIALFSNEDNDEIVILPPYEYFLNKFNNELEKLYKLVKIASDVANLKSEKDKEEFVLIFRELSRIKNKLDIFDEFSWDSTTISEQDFNDFKSAYLDIYHEIKKDDTPTSILDDIDFELELLRNDKINVDYILQLLADLDVGSSSFDKDKERILSIMSQTEHLRSKISLIENFIDTKLGSINDKDQSIPEEFDRYMAIKRKEAMCDIVEQEKMDETIARKIFDTYEFSGKLDDDLIKQSFVDKLKFKERKDKVRHVKEKISELFEIFDY